VVDSVLVEEVEGGEGAVAGRAVCPFDAVPAVLAARAGNRQPGGFVFRHNRRLRVPTDETEARARHRRRQGDREEPPAARRGAAARSRHLDGRRARHAGVEIEELLGLL
jgi:hypothetical protein